MKLRPNPWIVRGGMKWAVVISTVLLILLSGGGCFGPQKFSRHMDDWVNQFFIDSPWLAGSTLSVLILSVISVFTHVMDALVANPIDFWGISAWPFGSQGHGTPYRHKTPTIPAPR